MTSLKPDVLREAFALIGIDDIIDTTTSHLFAAGLSVRVDIKLEEMSTREIQLRMGIIQSSQPRQN